MAVPEYLRKLLAWKKQYMADQNSRATKAAEDAKEREFQRIKSLRRPPARVWRIGNTLFWDAPETMDELKPDGFWIEERGKGGRWWSRGDYLPIETRHFHLWEHDGEARVHAYYPQMAAKEFYYSPVVTRPLEDTNKWLVSHVQYFASERRYGEAHVKRWRRVLAAFGVATGHSVRGSWVGPDEPAMSLEEAEEMAKRYSRNRWDPVVIALRRIERIRS